MARLSRRKGAAGEREVRDIFRKFGFDCDRDGHGNFDGDLRHDITSVPINGTKVGFHFEIKRHEKISMGSWLEQAQRDAKPGDVPVVIWRRSNEGWHADLPLETLLGLLAANG